MNEDLTLIDYQVQADWLNIFWQQLEDKKIKQSQLAKSMGISRSYLNQLLNSKRPLTEAMRQRLTAAFRKLSGITALNICFDYVRIRFPTHDVDELIVALFCIKPIYFVYEPYGRYGYSGKFRHGDMEIFVSPEDDNCGSLIELKGKGCRELEGILVASEQSWYDFLRQALALDGVVKRIDLAINDYLDVLPVHYLIKKSMRHEYITKFRECKYFVRDKDNLKGESLYFGSRKSAIYFCIYQKDIEQYFKLGKALAETKIKNRFEIRVFDERAEQTVADLLAYRNPQRTVFGIINNYLRFVKPIANKPTSKWPLDDRWAQFIGKYADKLRLAVSPEPVTLDQTIQWIKKQVAPSLKMLMAIDSAKSEDTLMTIIAEAKLSENQQVMIQQMLASPEEIMIQQPKHNGD